MGRHRHSKFRVTLDDQNTTIPWLERQLAYRTVSFLAAPVVATPAGPGTPRSTALPEPMPEPILTPAPGSPIPTGEMTSAILDRVTTMAAPERVRQGDSLRLQLDHELSGTQGAAVTERRILQFNGKTLPGYPRERTLQRNLGHHSSATRQSIPTNAAAGSYNYLGEACVNGLCEVDQVAFEVVPQ